MLDNIDNIDINDMEVIKHDKDIMLDIFNSMPSNFKILEVTSNKHISASIKQYIQDKHLPYNVKVVNGKVYIINAEYLP